MAEAKVFELLDEVVSASADEVVARKLVRPEEAYLDDHFPGFKILPGVMMLETMVQAGRHLVRQRDDDPGIPLVVAEARKLTYAAMVRPGNTLEVRVKLRKAGDGLWAFEGRGTVGEREAVKGRFTLRPVKRPEAVVNAAAPA